MSLWKASLGEIDIGWRSPVRGPVHPGLVPLAEPGGLGWLDGFDELLVRCGLESNGAPDFDEQGRLLYPLHGRIGNRPAHFAELAVDDDSGEISVTGAVDESRFHFLKLRLTSRVSTRPGEAGLRIRDRVENLSASPAEFQLLYHVNFGAPLLEPGSHCLLPVKTVVPRGPRAAAGIANWSVFGEPTAGYDEQVYFVEPLAGADGASRALLKNAAGDLGASLHFDRRQLPWFTLWKNTDAAADGYVTGLEPGTNFPNPRRHEGRQGRVVRLDPFGEAVFDLRLEIHAGAELVARAESAISALQDGVEPTIYDQPQPGWCVL